MEQKAKATARRVSAVCVAILLAGCGTTLAPVPMASVSSQGVVMRGTLTPAMDFTGRFSLANSDGTITCAGATARSGQGTITCSDGQTAPVNIPKPPYGRLNGAYVDTFPWGKVAVGWGRDADVESLRALLP